MKNISITLLNGKETKTFEVPEFTKASQFIKDFDIGEEDIFAFKINNRIESISSHLLCDSTIEPVVKNSKEGSLIYRRSLSLVLAAAANKVFPETRCLVGHSLGNSYYYNIDNNRPDTKSDIAAIKKEMLSIIEKDLPFEYNYLSYGEAEKIFEKEKLCDTLKQLKYKCTSPVMVNSIGDFCDLYFGVLVPSSKYLKVFDLEQYAEGFLLKFPKAGVMDELPDEKDIPKLFNIYKKYKDWGKCVGVRCVADVNKMIATKKINDFIDICETFQNQNYAEVAHQIEEKKGVKVVLLAGPSSSGKTTSAKKLSLQLQALGYNPKIISLDNYYVGREENPKDENGNYDYECLEALNIKLLNENLMDLFNGKQIEVPQYNFDLGERFYNGTYMELSENDILVMEGIHGLNDALTPLIPNELKFKVYLSALTQLNLNDHSRIPTSDNRLIRRIVRDARYRGKSAASTISMWDSVQKGEQLHIFPFQNNADAILNTALDYELPVLKVYAEPLLQCVRPDSKEYAQASRLLEFLSNFSSCPQDYVPNQSIIREFIGGSSFHY